MTLKATLDQMREASSKRIPPDKQEIMKRGTDALRSSGAMDRVLKVGQTMPAFQGTAHDGRAISSGDLLARGAIVASFFRGHW